MIKKCEKCGTEFAAREEWFKLCPKCHRESKDGDDTSGNKRESKGKSNYRPLPRPDTTTNFEFNEEYLKDGYFFIEDGKPILRAEQLDKWAEEIAKLFFNLGMKSHQIRRLFNKARGIEKKTNYSNFAQAKEEIYSLKRDAAYQAGRKQGGGSNQRLVPEDFKYFIERNVDLACEDNESFRRGFLSHFESVLAYFVYYSRE